MNDIEYKHINEIYSYLRIFVQRRKDWVSIPYETDTVMDKLLERWDKIEKQYDYILNKKEQADG